MTLTEARAIYAQAIKIATSPAHPTLLTVGKATELKKLAKLLAKIGGFEIWEIEP